MLGFHNNLFEGLPWYITSLVDIVARILLMLTVSLLPSKLTVGATVDYDARGGEGGGVLPCIQPL